MKIAIVGSHGVGKTTLAKKLSKILQFPVIPDIARKAVSKGFAINETTPPETQFWILSKQIEYERELKDNFIADKTLFDNIVYPRYIFRDPHFLKILEDIVFRNAKYDLLLYVPIEIPLKLDGVRSPDTTFQKKIDSGYLKLLKDWKLIYHEIRGNIPERVKKSLDIINPFNNDNDRP